MAMVLSYNTKIKKWLFVLTLLTITACGSVSQICTPDHGNNTVYVVGQDWHTGIGIPVEEMGKNLDLFRNIFPGARVIMFGYGKKTFFTAPPDTMSEYFLGPFPGPAVIQVVGLRVIPTEAYSPDNTVTLALSAGGSRDLSTYIWNDLEKDVSGNPIVIAHSTDPDGLFYMAKSEYTLLHTCNTWAAESLNKANLPISSDGVIFSNQVMGRAKETAIGQCH